MRGNPQPRPPENISINISVNLRKAGPELKKSSRSKPNADGKQPRPKASKEATEGHAATVSISNPQKQPKSSRTFSEAPETVRVKTGETATATAPSATFKKKPRQQRKKSESNDKGRRRKDSLVNRSVDAVPRKGYPPNSKSKSKSSESSKSKSKSQRLVLRLEPRYVNTYENDGRVRLPHKLPLEEVEHLLSRYRKHSKELTKHSASIEPKKGSSPKKKGHKKNATLDVCKKRVVSGGRHGAREGKDLKESKEFREREQKEHK